MKTFSLAQNLKSANENAAKGLPISVSIEWAESFEIQKFRKNIVLLIANFTFYTNIKMQNFEGFNTHCFILTSKIVTFKTKLLTIFTFSQNPTGKGTFSYPPA